MREDEFARLIDEAVGTLRREAGEAWMPVRPDGVAEVAFVYQPEIAFASPYAVADALQLAAENNGADVEWASVEILGLPENTLTIDEFADAADIAAKLVPLEIPVVRPPSHDDALAPTARKNRVHGAMVAMIAAALLTTVGWRFTTLPGACRPADPQSLGLAMRSAADALAARIVIAESGGDAAAANKRSSATGAGQFLDGTWLDMIRAYRPDLTGQSEAAILDLRHDADLSREMVARFAEGNAAMLASRCLPVTPGTLYLAHFAGGAGAAAVLSASDYDDAAATIAEADATRRLTREKIVTANPFLEKFTVADLKLWADRKMITAAGSRLSAM